MKIFKHKKKERCLNKKIILFIISEILLGRTSTGGSSTMALINPGAGFISSSNALLTSIATLITNEFNSKLKIRYPKLRAWINVITLFYEKMFLVM